MIWLHLGLLLLAASCQEPQGGRSVPLVPSESSGPPSLELVVGSKRVEGVAGSRVWGGYAVDTAIQVPAELMKVDKGGRITFEGQGGKPDEISLSVYRRDQVSQEEATAVLEETLRSLERGWQVKLDPGQYVLGLFRAWKGRGDVIHYFSIEVVG